MLPTVSLGDFGLRASVQAPDRHLHQPTCPRTRISCGTRAPDGWPLWTSGVRPGREHDTTALRAHPEALPLLAEWTDAEHAALADLGYKGERSALTTPIKHPGGRRLTTN